MADAHPESALVFVVDDLLAKPGCGEALLAAYRARYVPGAVARGMTLVHELVAPAYWLPDGSNRLMFVWSVPGAAGTWRFKHAGRQDPAVLDWWERESATWIESRSRLILAEAAANGALADV